jgi:tRNA(Ile)-lysidine synthase
MAAAYERAWLALGLSRDGCFIVACSGGADSGAALLLTRRVAPGARLVACYVNHGLRPRTSIERDIAAVRAQAAVARASVRILRADVRRAAGDSPEERARTARYRALAQAARRAGAATIVTGHQRDDLAETVVLSLVRGSGLDGIVGLGGRRSAEDDVQIVRPLLWAAKVQCRALLSALRVPWSEDETNADLRVPRNAVRRLLSELYERLPQAASGIPRSAALLAAEKEFLDALAARALDRAADAQGRGYVAARLRGLPSALLRRAVRRAVALAGGSRGFSFAQCTAIERALRERRGGTFQAGDREVSLSAGRLIVRSPQPSPPAPAAVEVNAAKLPVRVVTPLGTLSLRAVRAVAQEKEPRCGPVGLSRTLLLDREAIASARLSIRPPRPGDRCIPSGRRRPISLARFLAKSGLARHEREQAAVLCAGGRIAAVLGLRVMEPFTPRPRRRVLEAGWRQADT